MISSTTCFNLEMISPPLFLRMHPGLSQLWIPTEPSIRYRDKILGTNHPLSTFPSTLLTFQRKKITQWEIMITICQMHRDPTHKITTKNMKKATKRATRRAMMKGTRKDMRALIKSKIWLLLLLASVIKKTTVVMNMKIWQKGFLLEKVVRAMKDGKVMSEDKGMVEGEEVISSPPKKMTRKMMRATTCIL